MSLEKNLSNTLDGNYWHINQNSSKRDRQKRRMGEFCKLFVATKKRRCHLRPRFEQRHSFSSTNKVVSSDLKSSDLKSSDLKQDILVELQQLNLQVEKISNRQKDYISIDAWQRYLQHFEQNIAELRELLCLQKPLEQEKNMSDTVQKPNIFEISEEETNFLELQSVKKEPGINEEQQERTEIAQTLVDLTASQSVVSNLHSFQMNGEYTWIAVDIENNRYVEITPQEIESIEKNYKTLLRLGKLHSTVPQFYIKKNVTINFLTRLGSVSGHLVRFSRIKK